jgi:hypothetical protein
MKKFVTTSYDFGADKIKAIKSPTLIILETEMAFYLSMQLTCTVFVAEVIWLILARYMLRN